MHYNCLLGAGCVRAEGVTTYLNQKMAEMEQTLAQMKGTRYVTEAQTADGARGDTERMPSVASRDGDGECSKTGTVCGASRNTGRCCSAAGGDGAGSTGDGRVSGKM